MSRCPTRIALAAALAVALAGVACGRYGPPRRAERPAVASQASETPGTPAPEEVPAPEDGEPLAPDLEP